MLDTVAFLDASLLPALAIAMFAGLLSFLSPCVLPIVPPYLAYMGGVSVGDMEEEQAKRQQSVEKARSTLDEEKARLELERKKMEEERET